MVLLDLNDRVDSLSLLPSEVLSQQFQLQFVHQDFVLQFLYVVLELVLVSSEDPLRLEELLQSVERVFASVLLPSLPRNVGTYQLLRSVPGVESQLL